MADLDEFWGDQPPTPRAGFHDLMASVGNLPQSEQAKYNRRSFGVGLPDDYIPPASAGGAGWWNEDSGGDTHPKPKQKKAKKDKKDKKDHPPKPKKQKEHSDSPSPPSSKSKSSSSSSSVTSYEIPLVNLDAPSPLIWMIGLAAIMSITLICEVVQMGGFAPMKENPFWGPDDSTMLIMGAKYGPLIVEGDWWRLFSASLLQNGLIYYLISMAFLFFCRNIERDAGFWRASLVFIVCATYGYILSCVFVPELISCGTTGAIFGYLGMMLSDLISQWRAVSAPYLRLFGMIGLIVFLLVLGLSPFVDNFMHIGGLLMGFLAALMLMPNLNFGKCEGMVHAVMALVSFPVMSIIFMVSLVIFFRRVDTDTTWCSWCMKATCVNISGWCK
jgi:membrane associated rhomboid family serine protease